MTLDFGDGACFLGYDPADRALRGSTVKVLTGSLAECGAGGAPAVGSPIDVPTVPEQHTPLLPDRIIGMDANDSHAFDQIGLSKVRQFGLDVMSRPRP